jgi:hypothetical protein
MMSVMGKVMMMMAPSTVRNEKNPYGQLKENHPMMKTGPQNPSQVVMKLGLGFEIDGSEPYGFTLVRVLTCHFFFYLFKY